MSRAGDPSGIVRPTGSGISLIEEGILGFNIIRCADLLFAIPQGEGAFEIARLTTGGYSRTATGRSVAEVKIKLLRASSHPVSWEQATLRAIRNSIKPGSKVVAFFCPDQAFRKNFGSLPRLLDERGYSVLYLYGTKVGDEFERHPTSFFVGGTLLERLDCVDLWFTATIMDALPKHGKKALLNHGAFAPFIPEAYENDMDKPMPDADLETQFQHVVREMTYNFAFFPLYDYYLASSSHHFEMLGGIAKRYGYATPGTAAGAPHPSCELFDRRHRRLGKALAETVYVIPAGYPQIDSSAAHIARYSGPKNVITFAPTPLNGKPCWEKYSALYHAGVEVIGALINAFPEYEIVFKPHVTDQNEATLRAINSFQGVANFRVDLSGSDHKDLYARTALMISDFSSTAYTFAVSSLRPVVFLSLFEEKIPEALRQEGFCRERSQVGRIVRNTTDMILAARELLSDAESMEKCIANFRDTRLFNFGRSESYICESIDRMILGSVPPEWACYRRVGGPQDESSRSQSLPVQV